ncbi:hypothetical protein JVU11DRAFT_92 [Chiua virens]|nr:hypothetical protein JVU11DRAFT_92 [Chiua virens]
MEGAAADEGAAVEVVDGNDGGAMNSDLFWALRGGGGFTYGIVTSVTYRTYTPVPVQLYVFQANTTNSSALLELVGGLLRFQTQFTDDGWGGYGSITNQQINFFYLGPNITNETAATTTQGWSNHTSSLAQFGALTAEQTYYSPSWYELYEILWGNGNDTGLNVMFTSRLLSRETVSTNYTQIVEILVNCTASFNTIAGGRVSQFPADSAGLNPAWRNAVVETMCGFNWADGTPSNEDDGLITQLKGWIKAIYDLSPNDGAYFNDASLFEIDFLLSRRALDLKIGMRI